MPEPRPVVITDGVNPNPAFDPEPLVAVGGLPTKTEVSALTPVTAANATAAASENPTKAEFDVLVTLANANKAKINAIITALKA